MEALEGRARRGRKGKKWVRVQGLSARQASVSGWLSVRIDGWESWDLPPDIRGLLD